VTLELESVVRDSARRHDPGTPSEMATHELDDPTDAGERVEIEPSLGTVDRRTKGGRGVGTGVGRAPGDPAWCGAGVWFASATRKASRRQ
jgi:hypothetical protein